MEFKPEGFNTENTEKRGENISKLALYSPLFSVFSVLKLFSLLE
jgi:hypothetical protein